MKKIGLLGLGVLFSLLTLAQKQINDPMAQVRAVSGYHAIKVSTGIKVYLTQGANEAVAVSATKAEYRDRIITKVENGVLKIYYDEQTLSLWKKFATKGRDPVAYVSVKNLDNLDISAGASVVGEGAITGNQLTIDVSSGATFTGEVKYNSLDVDQSSGSVVKISGTASALKVDGSSGSVFHGYDLATETCNAEVSSGASTQVTINKEMSARASSGGSIHYKGEGVIRNVKTGSGGNVSKRS